MEITRRASMPWWVGSQLAAQIDGPGAMGFARDVTAGALMSSLKKNVANFAQKEFPDHDSRRPYTFPIQFAHGQDAL